MGYDHMSTVTDDVPTPGIPPVKERVGDSVIVNKSNPVNLTGEKTVSKRHMTDKTYAEVVAQKEFRETEVLPFESTNKKESTERVKE